MALVALAVGVALGIVEVGLRLATRSALSGIHEARPDRPWLYGLRARTSATVAGIEYAINADGFRDRDYVRPKPPGTFRVVVLGDSIAFGWGVALEEAFPKVLEARLLALAPGKRIEVLSLGVSGYNPYTEAAIFRDVGVGYEPDLVLVAFCINDLNDPTLHFDAATIAALRDIPQEAFPDPTRRLPPRGPCSRFRVCALVSDTLAPNRAGELRAVEPHDDPPPGELAWLRDRYRDMASSAAAVGARFAVLVFPYQWQVERGAPTTIQTRLTALGDAEGWPTVDLLPAFRAAHEHGAGSLFIDLYHPTARAHGIAAESILTELGCHGLLPAGCPPPLPS